MNNLADIGLRLTKLSNLAKRRDYLRRLAIQAEASGELIRVPSKARAKTPGKSFRADVSSAFWSAGHAAWGKRAYGATRELRRVVRENTH